MSLRDIGFDPFFSGAFDRLGIPELVPGRVFSDTHEVYTVRTEGGDLQAEPSGRLRSHEELPVAGDWVAVRPSGKGSGTIEAVLPRRTWISRRSPGKRTEEQLMGANVDVVLAVVALLEDGSLRRLERLLALGRAGGARAVALLTKADLSVDLPAAIASARAVAGDAPVLAISVRSGEGLDALSLLLGPGVTAALVGASGAGKSTLINTLAGTDLVTREVRVADGRGRHTTTGRRLVPLRSGALLLDTPGLREVGLWDTDTEELFDDVDRLAPLCRFRDCGHADEPGCAVRAAVDGGTLDSGRLEAWRKLRSEEALVERRLQTTPARVEKERWKGIHKQIRKGKPPA
jgi:ribosome biogenesis GTPase